jgi:Fic family protein
VYRKSPHIGSPPSSTVPASEPENCLFANNLQKNRLSQVADLLLKVMTRRQPRASTEIESGGGLNLSGTDQTIVSTVDALGFATPAQVAKTTKFSRATTTRTLSRLTQLGVLQREGATRRVRYRCTHNKKT